MGKVILVTGSSSGFGEMSAYALANAGHTVYASMRETKGRNAEKVAKAKAFSEATGLALKTVDLDVLDEGSAKLAVESIVDQERRLDVVVHNAGHMMFGPAEAFTPEQYAAQYDVNVIGTQRVNRAALPYMRRDRSGLLLWVSSTSVRGGTPPYLAPYFAAKAAMESLAMSYAGELVHWGIETTILAPGVFSQGTNHFANSGSAADKLIETQYFEGPTRTLEADITRGHEAVQPPDSDPEDVARAIVDVVGMPQGKRPLHITVDRADMGYEVMAAMGDRIRADVYRRMGIESLLSV